MTRKTLVVSRYHKPRDRMELEHDHDRRIKQTGQFQDVRDIESVRPYLQID